MKNIQTDLVKIADDNGIQPSKTEMLVAHFTELFQDAKQTVAYAKDIVVTNESQREEMSKARKTRIELKSIRNQVENIRKELKEQSLREGKAIDGIANVIKALIIPVEQHLEKMEKFAQIKEAERKAKQLEERKEQLSKYMEDISVYNLSEISQESFDRLLADAKQAHETRLEAERKAEEARIERERKDKLLSKRRFELAPFRDFANPDIVLTLDTTQEEFQAILSSAKEAKKKYIVEQEKIKAENEKLKKEAEEKERRLAKERADQQRKIDAERKAQELKLKKEREEREKLEAKIRAEKEEIARKEREAKAAEEARQQAEEDARRKALLAPDKTKLMNLHADILSINIPAVNSKQAQDLTSDVQRKIVTLADWLYEESKKL